MSLADTINNTNTQKENTKKVATQIDNKLVELGGERATDLADVPNKIENTVVQRKKVARFTFDANYANVQILSKNGKIIKEININFIPSVVFVIFKGSWANINDERSFNEYAREITISNITEDKRVPVGGGGGDDKGLILEATKEQIEIIAGQNWANSSITLAIKEIICIE